MRAIRPPLLALLLTAAASTAMAQDIPADFAIRLERSRGCQIDCPIYSVSIDARGIVTYDGIESVRVTGRVLDRISPSQVRTLFQAVERVGFFQLLDRYWQIPLPGGLSVTTTERPVVFVSVTREGESKRVEDYFGAPRGLQDLERQIDRLARTQRWIRIDAQTLRQQVADGQPPTAEQRTEFLKRAIAAYEVDVVITLLELGADPSGPNDEEHAPPLFHVRSAAAARALLDAGADPLARSVRGQTAIWHATREAPEVMEVLLNAGVPADVHVDAEGTTALLHAAGAGNIGVVKLLLAAGASPYHRDLSGTALDAARRSRESNKQRLVPPEFRESRFLEDFDAVIAVLEEAMSKKPGR